MKIESGSCESKEGVAVAGDEALRGVKNVLQMTSGRVASQAVLVISAVVIPRFIGPEPYGRFSAVMAILAILSAIAAFGLPMVETRFLAPLWRAGPRDEAVVLGSTIWATRLLMAVIAASGTATWVAASASLATTSSLCIAASVLAAARFSNESTLSLFLPLGHPSKLVAFEFLRAVATIIIVVSAFGVGGLTGALAGLAVMHILLFATARWQLLRIIPLRLSLFDWKRIKAHLRFSTLSFLGTLAGMMQMWFSVYALAVWSSPREAAFLGIAVQANSLVKMLYLSAQQALMPILAELEVRQQSIRLLIWGGLMLRMSALSTSIVALCWSLLGRDIVHWALGDQYDGVYPSVTIILVGVVFYACASSCNALLYVRGLPGLGTFGLSVYAAVTIAVMTWTLVFSGQNEPSVGVAWAYVAGAVIFLITSYLILGLSGGLWLPWLRSLALTLPAVAAVAAAEWTTPFAVRFVAALVLPALFLGIAISCRLVTMQELKELLAAARSDRLAKEKH